MREHSGSPDGGQDHETGTQKASPECHPHHRRGGSFTAIRAGQPACRLLSGQHPFVLGLMYFWADMSRGANAGEHCTLAALSLASLYIWMKFWHAVFAHQVGRI